MLSERERTALLSILDNATFAQNWVGELDAKAFAEDRKTFYAVTRCLEIISEAVRRLPPALHARYPHIPWRRLMDAGNIYRHDYDNVSETLIWRAVHERLPEVIKATLKELERE